jgi:protein involved in polysaccharide export with SLBB domain
MTKTIQIAGTTKAELAHQNTELKLEINKAHLALTELRAYLQSSKFYEDPTVQTADVLRRLDEVRLTYDETIAKWSALMDASAALDSITNG